MVKDDNNGTFDCHRFPFPPDGKSSDRIITVNIAAMNIGQEQPLMVMIGYSAGHSPRFAKMALGKGIPRLYNTIKEPPVVVAAADAT